MSTAHVARGRRALRWTGLAVLLAALALVASGCSTLGYYAQSVQGHLSMLHQARPIDDWLADPSAPEALKQRLRQAREMRAFAVNELHLPDNASYYRYADLGREAVVWNVVAAPELSLKLHTWCYPIMGCVGYRGYFDRAAADVMAATLKAQGLEVAVYGVPAYSTLGWSNWLGGDPLLNTFVNGSEAAMARLIFHELSHQVVYADNDTAFNESYATAVERLGLARWRAAHPGMADDSVAQQRQRDFRELLRETRAELQAVYAEGQTDAQRREDKARVMAGLRARYERLKRERWDGYDGYDGWIQRANNAMLALQAAYDGLVPAFERLFEAEGRDFARFHAAVGRLAQRPRDERRAILGVDPPALSATSTASAKPAPDTAASAKAAVGTAPPASASARH